MLLHRNLVANVLQVVAWNEPMVDQAPPVIDRMIIVTALPLYHIFALTACFLFGVRTGGMCLLIPNPRDIRRPDQGGQPLQGEYLSRRSTRSITRCSIIPISASSTGAC